LSSGWNTNNSNNIPPAPSLPPVIDSQDNKSYQIPYKPKNIIPRKHLGLNQDFPLKRGTLPRSSSAFYKNLNER